MHFNNTDLLIIFSSLTILVVVFMMVLIYIFFIKKKSQLLLEQQQKVAIFRQELASSQVEMKEQTLSYIGQELHDDLGQKLSVAKLMNNQLIHVLDGENKESLKEINELLGECIQDIRNLSKTLITEQIEHFGLMESIEREVKRIKKLNLLKINFQFNEHDIDINSKHALILFRIVQECMNNTLKHSRAKEMSISVQNETEKISIQLKDNGIGFDDTEKQNGSGLKSIRNRAKLINTEFEIFTKKNQGTTVHLTYRKN